MPSGRAMTHEEFVEAFNNKFDYAKEYLILNKFTNSKERLQVKHIPCGNIWDLAANNLRIGNQCPECSGNKHKNNEGHKTFSDFLKRNLQFSTNDKYTNLKTKVNILHKKCNKTFSVTPTNLYKHGCPTCNGGVKIDHEEFIRRLFERRNDFKNKEYIVKNGYENNLTKIEVYHSLCKKTWKVSPSNLMEGVCCPSCSCTGPSADEVNIQNFIKEIIPKAKMKLNSRSTLKSKRELDIFLPDYNFAIEYNGLYWHSDSVKIDRNYHFSKTESCLEDDITLFHVYENEWLLKNNVVKNMIKDFLGKNKLIKGERLTPKEISIEISSDFLFKNSLYNKANEDSLNFGLYAEGKIVFVISGNYKNKSFIVERYSCAMGKTIKEAFSYFKKIIKEKIVVNHDLRFPLPNGYTIKNLSVIDILNPSYHLFKENTLLLEEGNIELENRIKNDLEYNPNNSFSKNLEDLRYRRIWGCGKILFNI